MWCLVMNWGWGWDRSNLLAGVFCFKFYSSYYAFFISTQDICKKTETDADIKLIAIFVWAVYLFVLTWCVTY